VKKLVPIFLILVTFSAQAQQNLVLEIGGTAGMSALKYQKHYRFLPAMSWETGLSLWPGKSNFFVTVPFGFNYLLGKNEHHLELGTGQFFVMNLRGGDSYIRGSFRVGYRHHNPEKQLFYSIAYTPLYSYFYNFQYQNWFGFAIGYQFKSKKVE
jgi:hypothetical protein